ncbi:hypothetical protein KKG72_10170 [bacterium]|nr:hypothetical protein [bacterium]MBU1995208.1 hypothetical protein [bacterium]
MLHASNEKLYVASYKELVLIFITFTVILFFLYPKDLLKEQILSEEANYDLSMLYLKNMLVHDPENESLMIALAELSLQSGKKDLSLRLLELLHKSKDVKIRKKAHLLNYRLSKEDYFFVEDKEQKMQIMQTLRRVFANIIEEEFYHPEDVEKWYKEAIFLGDLRNQYLLLKKRILQDADNVELLEEAYHLSKRMHQEEDTLLFLHTLELKDFNKRDEWRMAEYYWMIDKKSFEEAELLLKKYASDSLLWGERLAMFYSARGAFPEASNAYMSLYNHTTRYSNKINYLLKAINALQAGNHVSEAVGLGHKYEDLYLNDKAVRIYLLKLYIASGELQKASNLSKKILNKVTK